MLRVLARINVRDVHTALVLENDHPVKVSAQKTTVEVLVQVPRLYNFHYEMLYIFYGRFCMPITYCAT